MATADEILNQLLKVNQENGKRTLVVGTNRDSSSFTNEYTTSQSSTAIISPSSGNRICTFGFLIHASGNIGTISLDYSGGNHIASLYTNTGNKIQAHNLNIPGPVDEDVEVDGGGDSFMVLVNYAELEG